MNCTKNDIGTIAQQAIDDALAEGWRTLPDSDTESQLREAIRVLAVMYATERKRVSGGYVRRGFQRAPTVSTAGQPVTSE